MHSSDLAGKLRYPTPRNAKSDRSIHFPLNCATNSPPIGASKADYCFAYYYYYYQYCLRSEKTQNPCDIGLCCRRLLGQPENHRERKELQVFASREAWNQDFVEEEWRKTDHGDWRQCCGCKSGVSSARSHAAIRAKEQDQRLKIRVWNRILLPSCGGRTRTRFTIFCFRVWHWDLAVIGNLNFFDKLQSNI